MTDNTVDGFSYKILSVANYSNNPLQRNPITLVCCVARPRTITSTDVATCLASPNGFNFYNRRGVEIVGTEENNSTSSPQDNPDGYSSTTNNDNASPVPNNETGVRYIGPPPPG